MATTDKNELAASRQLYANIPFNLLASSVEGLVASMGVTANAVSLIGLLSGVAAGVAWSIGGSIALVIGAVFAVLFEVMGALDGRVARLNRTFSMFGSWINAISERVGYLAMALGFSYHALRVAGDPVIAFGAFAGVLIRECIATFGAVTAASISTDRWKAMQKREMTNVGSPIFVLAVRAFTYSGATYTYLLLAGLIPLALPAVVAIMVVYGFLFYVALVCRVAREVATMA